jgi:hypothetical protein
LQRSASTQQSAHGGTDLSCMQQRGRREPRRPLCSHLRSGARDRTG